jgi:hypothetical protein
VRRIPILHPILLAIFPILFLAVQNIDELFLGDIVRPLIAAAVVAVLLLLLFRVIARSWQKSALLTSFSTLLLFSFGHLSTALRGVFEVVGLAVSARWVAMIAVAAIWALLAWLILRSRRQFGRVTAVMNAIALVLVGLQVAQGGYLLLSRPHSQLNRIEPTITLDPGGRTPDIYYIVLDAFGREDVIREIYGYDNSWFIEELRRLGFYVADKSHSNYCQTSLSLASTLNLKYIHDLGDFDPASHDRGPLTVLLQDNLVFGLLKEQGYELTAFGSAFPPTEFKSADTYSTTPLALSEFETTVLGTTPLPVLIPDIASEYVQHRRRIHQTFEGLVQVDLDNSPQIVFAHLMTPHPPFIFDGIGRPVQPDRPFYFGRGTHYFEKGGSLAEYVLGYAGQVEYISKLLAQTIRDIIDRYDADSRPIIIVQGDHGPGSRLYWQNVHKIDIKECFAILNAIYLPGCYDSLLYPSITPINTFRVVLDQCFNADCELLPDRSIFTAWTRPYLWFEVTEQLKVLSAVADRKGLAGGDQSAEPLN